MRTGVDRLSTKSARAEVFRTNLIQCAERDEDALDRMLSYHKAKGRFAYGGEVYELGCG